VRGGGGSAAARQPEIRCGSFPGAPGFLGCLAVIGVHRVLVLVGGAGGMPWAVAALSVLTCAGPNLPNSEPREARALPTPVNPC
jgi:hypothetical protein